MDSETQERTCDALTIEFAGRQFLLDPVAGSDLVARQVASGGYEAPLPMLIAAVVMRLGGLFLDVGANNGVYSLIAAAVRPDIGIVAFEPFPPIIELLRRNIALNGRDQQIRVVEAALGDRAGRSTIFLPNPGHGLIETSASLQADFVTGSSPAMTVETRRLDDIALGAAVSAAKVDIEGFELEFIRGAQQTIMRDRPVIFAEMLNRSVGKFPEITRRMADMDYLLFRLRPDMAILAHWIVFDEHAWNYCFLPRERLGLFREICAIHSIEILSPA